MEGSEDAVSEGCASVGYASLKVFDMIVEGKGRKCVGKYWSNNARLSFYPGQRTGQDRTAGCQKQNDAGERCG